MDHPWTSTPEHVLEHFGVDSSRGLTAAHAAKHAEVYGKNGQFGWFMYLVVVVDIVCRASRRTSDSAMGAYSRTVQGPASVDTACVGSYILRFSIAR
jgi:hypothetical protein